MFVRVRNISRPPVPTSIYIRMFVHVCINHRPTSGTYPTRHTFVSTRIYHQPTSRTYPIVHTNDCTCTVRCLYKEVGNDSNEKSAKTVANTCNSVDRRLREAFHLWYDSSSGGKVFRSNMSLRTRNSPRRQFKGIIKQLKVR